SVVNERLRNHSTTGALNRILRAIDESSLSGELMNFLRAIDESSLTRRIPRRDKERVPGPVGPDTLPYASLLALGAIRAIAGTIGHRMHDRRRSGKGRRTCGQQQDRCNQLSHDCSPKNELF